MYDYILMFKVLVIQRMYHQSDEQVKYQIIDRTSFRDFLRLSRGDKVPDVRTIWSFREQLTKQKCRHVFGFCEQGMNGMFSRVVGLIRSMALNTLTNLVYNMNRFEQIMRLGMNWNA